MSDFTIAAAGYAGTVIPWELALSRVHPRLGIPGTKAWVRCGFVAPVE